MTMILNIMDGVVPGGVEDNFREYTRNGEPLTVRPTVRV